MTRKLPEFERNSDFHKTDWLLSKIIDYIIQDGDPTINFTFVGSLESTRIHFNVISLHKHLKTFGDAYREPVNPSDVDIAVKCSTLFVSGSSMSNWDFLVTLRESSRTFQFLVPKKSHGATDNFKPRGSSTVT